jgi:1,4-dihydroxy-2-naphthoyl-CoA hydrolase
MAFEYPVYIGMSSVDRAGVLFYPELFRHAHDAYEAFMTELGQDLAGLIDARERALPIVHAEADYLRPLRHGTRTRVRVWVERIGRTSFAIAAEFIGPSGEPCARVSTVHVCIEPAGGQPLPLPEDLRARLAGV